MFSRVPTTSSASLVGPDQFLEIGNFGVTINHDVILVIEQSQFPQIDQSLQDQLKMLLVPQKRFQ